MSKTQDHYKKARKLIPGGSQLFSKRPERFAPELWPAYYQKAKGRTLWDLDGNKYIDMSLMGIGSCLLGYADSDVDGAVKRVIDEGSMATVNAPEEVELAETLCALHPWADMARFARTGGEAVTIAIRIARAYTDKDRVLFCGYHGWHDWYLAANLADRHSLDGHILKGLEPRGVPQALRGTAIPFAYNDTEGFLKAAEKYKKSIGAIIMEPVRGDLPGAGFLETIREYACSENIPLIFDEVTAAWRLCLGGAHKTFGIEPDIAIFGKGMSNGYPMAAVIGRKKFMEHAAELFISSTYWTERIGPAAALATIAKMKDSNLSGHVSEIGRAVKKGWQNLAGKHSLSIDVNGMDALGHFSFLPQTFSAEAEELRTLFIQTMLGEGFLAATLFYPSLAHTAEDVTKYLEAVDRTFALIAKAGAETKIRDYLKSGDAQSDFARLV